MDLNLLLEFELSELINFIDENNDTKEIIDKSFKHEVLKSLDDLIYSDNEDDKHNAIEHIKALINYEKTLASGNDTE